MHDLEVHQMDVKTAFLNGSIDSEIFIRASTWKEISFQKEILAIGRKKEGDENFKEIGRKFDGEMRNLKTM